MNDRKSRRSELSVVHVEQGLARAHVVKAKLESAGIPALLDYESAAPIIGITIDGMGAVRILVPSERADEARELIE